MQDRDYTLANDRMVKLMQSMKIGEQPDSEGVCKGFASVLMLAILERNTDEFMQLFGHLLDVPVDSIAIDAKRKTVEITKSSSTVLQYDELIQTLWDTIEKKVSKHIDSQGLLKPTQALLHEMELFANTEDHPELFTGQSDSIYQNPKLVLQKIKHQALEEKGGVVMLTPWSDICNRSDLGYLFFLIQKRVMAQQEQETSPLVFAFIMDNLSHSIVVGFDAKLDNPWIIGDIERLPLKNVSNGIEAAAEVIKCLSVNGLSDNPVYVDDVFAVFSANVFTTKEVAPVINECLLECRQDERWLKLSEINEEKAQRCDIDGSSLLLIDAMDGNEQGVKQLLQKGADPNQFIHNHEALTPLFLATQHNHVKAMEMLLQAGAKPNQRVLLDGGNSPLYMAASEGFVEAAKLLLQYGADATQPLQHEDETPLYAAVSEGHWELAELLIAHGADPEPYLLKIAKTNGNEKMVAVLEDAIDMIEQRNNILILLEMQRLLPSIHTNRLKQEAKKANSKEELLNIVGEFKTMISIASSKQPGVSQSSIFNKKASDTKTPSNDSSLKSDSKKRLGN